MNKTLLSILALLCCMNMSAEPVTREQAQQKARQFLTNQGKAAMLSEAKKPVSAVRGRDGKAKDYYYVFNNGQEQGYVIVSADDRTPAVLGFSEHGTFDAEKIPENMKAWLQGYEEQIKYIQEHPDAVGTRRANVPTHPDVSNMIKTKWNQTSPYNDLLPTYNGQKCLTGCGATALALHLSGFSQNRAERT